LSQARTVNVNYVELNRPSHIMAEDNLPTVRRVSRS
jgi:hypothetical protein